MNAPGFGPPRTDTPPANWHNAVQAAREVGFGYFDFLSAIDNEPAGIEVVVHLMAVAPDTPIRELLIVTTLPTDDPRLATISDLFAGAAWHERETAEMFGVTFDGHPDPSHLLLGEDFDGHPLRKDFVLSTRNETPWPGIKDPAKDRR